MAALPMRASIAVAWVSHHYFVSWCVKMRKREREEGMVERGKEGGESTRTGFERERGDVDDNFGARLEDDEEHADRA